MSITAYKTCRKLVAFGLVGIIGTVAHYVTLIMLVEIVHADPVVATTLGFLVGAVVNFLLNHRYTFRSTKAYFETGPKFLLIAITTGILNTLLVYTGLHWFNLNYLIAQIISTVVVFLANFVLNDLWTFRQSKDM
jgi:putative flippase GtrA